MVFRAVTKIFGLLIVSQVLFMPFQAKAELDCFRLLREKSEIARDFEDHFLPRINGLEVSQNFQIDRKLLKEIVESVKNDGFFRVTTQVRESSSQFNTRAHEEVAEQAVRVAYSKHQYFNFDRETFVRFFPENINLAQILGALKRAVILENFTPREVVYSRRDGVSPEMIADTHLVIHDQVISLRFAIVIPRKDPGQPLVTLLTPLVTDRTHGTMTTVFLNAHNWEDHLVVSRWVRGRPVEGALVKASQSLNVLKSSIPFEEIVEKVENTKLIEDFDEQLIRTRTFYDRSFERVFEGWFKDGIVRSMSEYGELDLFNSVRNQLAPFPYFGYKKANTIEHAAVQRALPIFLKPEFRNDYYLSFFPPFIKREVIIKALQENILARDFTVGVQSKDYTYSAKIFTRLKLDGELYPVEAILSFPKEKGKRLSLLSLHPVLDSKVSNRMMSVFFNNDLQKFLVITRWFDGDPVEGLVIDR